MSTLVHPWDRRRAPRRVMAGVTLLAVLLLLAFTGHVPHSHASPSPALFNEQHTLENPAVRGGDVPLPATGEAPFTAILMADAPAADDSAPSLAFARHGSPRAPPTV